MPKIKAGIIGYGYWGPNIARNFEQNIDIELKCICDLSQDRLNNANELYPRIKTTLDPDDVLLDTEIDLVAVITPVKHHFVLAKKAIENGKHVFIEKPMTSSVEEAEMLVDLAHEHNRVLMVDHTFLFTGAVKKIKELIDYEQLGELYYYDSVRINLGLFQHDVNVIWDLAPHDLSILLYLVNKPPVAVSAVGSDHFNSGLEDVAYLHLHYNNGFTANFHVNWLSPVKIRKTILAGNRKMIEWDDLLPSGKVKVYDKGVTVDSIDGVHQMLVQYRTGDMTIPKLENIEALKSETEYLVDCIQNYKAPFNDGQQGLAVVKILQASEESLRQGGVKIKI